MASSSCSSSSRAPQAFLLTLFFLLFNCCRTEARDILVGGKTDSWKVPSSQSESLNQWAARYRFLIGDSLVWKYDTEDSVLQVSRKDYLNCNVSSPIAEYKNGNTKVVLDRSGPFFFISGAEGHCQKGQKLIVLVLSEKHGFMGISPSQSPTPFDGPAMAPTSEAPGLRWKDFGVSVLVVCSTFVGMVLL